ncbi:unnamed protein product [Brassicogethes aeneus]|uniref:Uncharacterized protein n=1 Tax=Brassicogethes aeneus TaxID=1431903 RepID=A0A9P0AVI5_BRAAE|nr:unnamed protein product [Brassicogethes aeneus]
MKSEKSLVVILNKVEDCGVVKGSITRKAFQDKSNLHFNMAKTKEEAVVKEVSKENLVKKDVLGKNKKQSIITKIQTRRARLRSNVNKNEENIKVIVTKSNLSPNKTINEQNTKNLITEIQTRTRSSSNIKENKENKSVTVCNLNSSQNKATNKQMTNVINTKFPTRRTKSRSNTKENEENKSLIVYESNLSKGKVSNVPNSCNKHNKVNKILQVEINNENLVKIRQKLSTGVEKRLQVDIMRDNLVKKQAKLIETEQKVLPQKKGIKSTKTTENVKETKTEVLKNVKTRGKKKLENSTIVDKGPIQIKLDKFCQIDIVKKPIKEKKTKFYLEKPKQIHQATQLEINPDKPEKFIRPKKYVNYAEISQNESSMNKNPPKPAENKIPVYRQQEAKVHNDNIEDDTNSYDKNMEVVMERLKTKINKQKVKFLDEKPSKNVPYKDDIIHVEKSKEKVQRIETKVHTIDEIDDDLPFEEILEPMEVQDDPIDIPVDVSNNFGFEAGGESPVKSNDKVVIHQNILLTSDKSIGSPSFFNRRRPNANSTMLCLPNNSPWRFGGQGGRNPHFLKIKNSALPAIEQDVIMDHTFDDKLKEHTNNQSRAASFKVPTQKSIVNFVTIEHTVVKENLHSNSLFDVDQLSPLKNKSNSPRKILGDRNTVNSTPLRGAVNRIQQPDLSMIHPNNENSGEKENSLFGFSNLDDSVGENNQENPLAKPFRFNIDRIKKYARRKKKVVKVIEEPEVIPEVNEEIIHSEESQEDDYADVRLFEDPEKQEIKEITLPTRKRTKIMCLSPGKKKKAKKQKEDPAYTKWVKDMNSTFAEIDNFELEVE